MNNWMREVDYATYCPKCVNFKVLETDEPCNELSLIHISHHLMDMGVTVKQTRPNPEKTYDEPFLPTYFVPVNVNMESKWPPHVYWVTTTGKKLLCDIDMVGQLDYIRVKNVNCLCKMCIRDRCYKAQPHLRRKHRSQSIYREIFTAEKAVEMQ